MRPIRTTLAILILALASLGATTAASAAAPLSIKVEGNHFVNGDGQTIRLLGVNRTSSEYACAQGYGYDDGHYDDADAAAIASWDANAVRVPLNEDCWLGINGQPNSSQGAEPPLTKAGYQGEIESYVADLNAHGIYAILDLHWTAPGAHVALGQQPMPDADHSPAFWTSVATAFKGDPAVVFDVFNEPLSPTDPRSGDDPDPSDAVSWACWKNGGCSTAEYDENGERTGAKYKVAGMQSLVDAIRGAGAPQPIMVGGLNYANDLSGWLANRPTDPLGQLAASFHNYQLPGAGKCEDLACWESQIAPVAASVPLVTGEFAQSGCYSREFDNEYMSWADAHGISYLGWAWVVLTEAEMEAEGCDAYYLITDYSGTPSAINGAALRTHLIALAAGGTPGQVPAAGGVAKTTPAAAAGLRLTGFAVSVKAAGASLTFQVAASESCAATISGQTTKRFKLGGHKARPVALGAAHLSLNAGKTATVTMPLSGKARGLLRAKRALPVRFAVTLRGAGAPVRAEPTATLHAPPAKSHHRKH